MQLVGIVVVVVVVVIVVVAVCAFWADCDPELIDFNLRWHFGAELRNCHNLTDFQVQRARRQHRGRSKFKIDCCCFCWFFFFWLALYGVTLMRAGFCVLPHNWSLMCTIFLTLCGSSQFRRIFVYII